MQPGNPSFPGRLREWPFSPRVRTGKEEGGNVVTTRRYDVLGAYDLTFHGAKLRIPAKVAFPRKLRSVAIRDLDGQS